MSEAHIGHLGEYYCKQVIQDSKRLLQSNTHARHDPGERRTA